jgi:glutamyl-Q tRNA(Asp) synthetase
VRGSDLLDSTARQIELQRQLNLAALNYAHLPVAVNKHGEKLSKQTRAPALDWTNAPVLLFEALHALGQQPDRNLRGAHLAEIWHWARSNWQLGRVPRQRALPYFDRHCAK